MCDTSLQVSLRKGRTVVVREDATRYLNSSSLNLQTPSYSPVPFFAFTFLHIYFLLFAFRQVTFPHFLLPPSSIYFPKYTFPKFYFRTFTFLHFSFPLTSGFRGGVYFLHFIFLQFTFLHFDFSHFTLLVCYEKIHLLVIKTQKE